MKRRALYSAFLFLCASGVQAELLHDTANSPESRLIGALQQFTRQEKIDPAINDLEHLVETNPKFRLAQLVYADMLMAKAGPLNGFGNNDKTSGMALEDLRAEIRMRWQHHSAPSTDNMLPDSIVSLSSKQKYTIVVDLGKSRLYLFENNNGIPKRVSDFYISVGKKGYEKFVQGDKKTPLGVYEVTRFISDENLPDFYGSGAFPINYPNTWDRRLGKTGYGIWLHGTPRGTYSRPPRASDGCVALSNDDFSSLLPFVDINRTNVILTDAIKWIDQQAWLNRRERLEQNLGNWQRDWESMDTNRYLAHYAKDFKSGNTDIKAWSAHKRRVNSQKKFIRVKLEDLNIFMYPGEENMFKAQFTQHYGSNNFSKASSRKYQYWKRSADGHWQIVYEGPSS